MNEQDFFYCDKHWLNTYTKNVKFHYQFIIFKFLRINSIFIVDISISFHDTNAPGSSTMEVSAGMKAHITESLLRINNLHISNLSVYTKSS